MEQRPAIFLDRDGTLILDAGYIGNPDLVEFFPGAFSALRSFQEAGYTIVVISNQSGIGRGLITQSDYEQVRQRIDDLLALENVRITATYYCPHAPKDECECRKPKPYLLLQAARDLHIDFSRSWMIGDKVTDVETGKAVGCRTILFRPPGSELELEASAPQPDGICPDWGCIAALFQSCQ